MINLEHIPIHGNEYWQLVYTDEYGTRTILGELIAYCKMEGGGYSILAGAGYESIEVDTRKGQINFIEHRKLMLDRVEAWIERERPEWVKPLEELRAWRKEREI